MQTMLVVMKSSSQPNPKMDMSAVIRSFDETLRTNTDVSESIKEVVGTAGIINPQATSCSRDEESHEDSVACGSMRALCDCAGANTGLIRPIPTGSVGVAVPVSRPAVRVRHIAFTACAWQYAVRFHDQDPA